MKNIDERMEEISRRSERIIRTRKQTRKNLLITLIPVTLCVGVLCAFKLPDAFGTRSSVSYSAVETPSTLEETKLASGKIEVSGPGVSHVYTEAKEVTQIRTLLDILSTPNVNNTTADFNSIRAEGDDSNETFSTVMGDACQENGYRIVITDPNGSKQAYLLAGQVLTDVTAGKSFTLHESDYFALKDALGICLY